MEHKENGSGGQEPLDDIGKAGSGGEKKENASQPSTKKKKGGSVLMQKIGLSLVSLLIGALAASLVLYLPTDSKLREAQSELERLTGIEEQYAELQAEHSLFRSQSSIYKTISSLSMLESALLSADATRINQQLRYVEDDLDRLEVEGFDEIQQRMMSQFSKVKSSARSTPQAALNELRVLLNDLLLFSDNLY